MALKTTVNSREFDVSLTPSGHFCTELEGERIAAESMRELTAKLKARMAQLQHVSVPALLIDHDGWSGRRGVITFTPVTLTGTYQGRHRDLTYREGNDPKIGKAGTGSHFYRRIAEEEQQALVVLHQAQEQARRDFVAALKALEMNAADEVEKAAYLGSIPVEPPTEKPKRRGKKK